MTFKELKLLVSKNAGVPQEIADKVVEEVFQGIKTALKKGDRLQIPMFGVFFVEEKGKQKLKRVKPAFVPSRALKSEVEKHLIKGGEQK